jgi:hypothetical protein
MLRPIFPWILIACLGVVATGCGSRAASPATQATADTAAPSDDGAVFAEEPPIEDYFSIQERSLSRDKRFREERVSDRGKPALAASDVISFLQPHIVKHWRVKGAQSIGQILDSLLDEELHVIWTDWYIPSINAKVSLQKSMIPAEYKTLYNDAYRALRQDLITRYDQNQDGSLILAELGDFGSEVIPTTFRAGKISRRSTLQFFLVCIRYADSNGNALMDPWEHDALMELRREILNARGNQSAAVLVRSR